MVKGLCLTRDLGKNKPVRIREKSLYLAMIRKSIAYDSLVSRVESLVSRDEVLVSREGGNLLLSSTAVQLRI